MLDARPRGINRMNQSNHRISSKSEAEGCATYRRHRTMTAIFACGSRAPLPPQNGPNIPRMHSDKRTMSEQQSGDRATVGAEMPSNVTHSGHDETTRVPAAAAARRGAQLHVAGLTCLAVAAALVVSDLYDPSGDSLLPFYNVVAANTIMYDESDGSVMSRSRTQRRRRRRRQLRRNQPVHLLYSSDDRSLQGVEASIRSVIHHASEDVVFHFVGESPLPSMPYVNYYNISEVVEKYHLTDFINTHKRHNGDKREGVNLNENMPNYVRFVMDDLLPSVGKAMWIDSDTVVRCDVVHLVRNVLNEDNEENEDTDNSEVIAAVPVFSPPTGLYKNDKHGNPFPDWGIETSFNAGVYVVHLDRWREQKISDQIRDLALRNRKYRYYEMGSQPPLVLTVGENFEHLPLSWNVKMKTIDEREDMSLEDACVLHWSGPMKPWDGNGNHLEEWLPYHIENAEDPSADGEEEDA